jgi:hypothetical protein
MRDGGRQAGEGLKDLCFETVSEVFQTYIKLKYSAYQSTVLWGTIFRVPT